MLNTVQIPFSTQPRLLYLLVETNVIGQVKNFAPVNLALVVDASESMRIRLVTEAQFQELASMGLMQEVMTDGVPAWQMQDLPRSVIEQFPRKMDFVIEALQVVAEQLRPEDVVSLVAFATQARSLLPVVAGKEKEALLSAIQAFASVELGDDTFLGQGMGLGYTSMKSGDTKDHINRLVLLTDGFTRDLSDCWRWMEQARLSGTTISTMGVGDEFNEELLIPLAEQTGGQAYFIRDPNEIPAIFREELQSVQSISYRNSELKLQLTPGVELRKAYRVKPLISTIDPGPNQNGSYTIDLGNIEQDAAPSLLLELIVPTRGNGRFRIAQALLSSDPVGENRQTVRQDIVVECGTGQGSLNGYVMNIVERVTAFKLQTRALDDAAVGDLAGATRKLRAAATRLLDMGEVELAQTISQQANGLEQESELDAQITKRLRYDTRRLTQKLS